jgi:hypothetical protein
MKQGICSLATNPSDIIQTENQFFNILADKTFEFGYKN